MIAEQLFDLAGVYAGGYTQDTRQIEFFSSSLTPDKLLLQNATICERLGRLFSIELDLLSSDENIAFEDLIGSRATIRIGCESFLRENTRFFNGYISHFSQVHTSDTRFVHYRATMVPWLWLLTQNSTCRIFQNLTMPEILRKVFADYPGLAKVREEIDLTRYNNQPIEYCVQYNEDDFSFLSRLMEQEGMYYFFEHDREEHTLVLVDSAYIHHEFADYAQIQFLRNENAFEQIKEYVSAWNICKQIQPTVYAARDFNYSIPKNDLHVNNYHRSACAENLDSEAAEAEHFEYPGRYQDPSTGNRYAKVRMDEFRNRSETITGKSTARGLAVGHIFELLFHPRADQNRRYLVTEITYQIREHTYDTMGKGRNPQKLEEGGTCSFDCAFSAIDAEMAFSLARITPKPRIRGPQTAFVVGPAGEEIYTDQARVKVQFHWDRYGSSDDHSSCWLRVSQSAWAGNEWGSLFIPRVGHEVIVEFLDGDPDRPVITGNLYNGAASPPYQEKTVSTIKSCSSPGAEGFNEIRFQDKKDAEELYMRAQKDRKTEVLHDHEESIGHDQTLVVKNDRTTHIQHDDLASIGHHQKVKIKLEQQTEAERIFITAEKSITFTVGDSWITISPEGISIKGTTIEMIGRIPNATLVGTATLAGPAIAGYVGPTTISLASVSGTGTTTPPLPDGQTAPAPESRSSLASNAVPAQQLGGAVNAPEEEKINVQEGPGNSASTNSPVARRAAAADEKASSDPAQPARPAEVRDKPSAAESAKDSAAAGPTDSTAKPAAGAQAAAAPAKAKADSAADLKKALSDAGLKPPAVTTGGLSTGSLPGGISGPTVTAEGVKTGSLPGGVSGPSATTSGVKAGSVPAPAKPAEKK